MRVRDLGPAHEPVAGRRLEEDPRTPARVAEERLELLDPHGSGGYGGRPTSGISPFHRGRSVGFFAICWRRRPQPQAHRPSGVRSGAVLALASVLAIGLNYAFLLAAGRLLGSEDYGALGALLGLLTLVLLPTSAVQLAVSREVSRQLAVGEREKPTRSVGPHSASGSSPQCRSSRSRSCSPSRSAGH